VKQAGLGLWAPRHSSFGPAGVRKSFAASLLPCAELPERWVARWQAVPPGMRRSDIINSHPRTLARYPSRGDQVEPGSHNQ
jgi:hypothetical protein